MRPNNANAQPLALRQTARPFIQNKTGFRLLNTDFTSNFIKGETKQLPIPENKQKPMGSHDVIENTIIQELGDKLGSRALQLSQRIHQQDQGNIFSRIFSMLRFEHLNSVVSKIGFTSKRRQFIRDNSLYFAGGLAGIGASCAIAFFATTRRI